MKNSINYKAAVLGAMLSLSFNAQDKPAYFTDNGAKMATELDCTSLKDLVVKAPVSSKMFKYDAIDITIEVNMNEKFPGSSQDAVYVYGIYLKQKEFSIKYEGEKEMSFAVISTKDGYGDFVGDDGKIREGVLCGSTPKEKVDLRFSVTGYVQTGEKEYYNETARTWEKQPTYGEGTVLGEANISVKQTAENMASAKKSKMKKRFGL